MRLTAEHLYQLIRDQRFRYIIASGFSFTLAISLSFLMKSVIGLNEKVAVGITLIIVFFVNFIIIRYFVFQSTAEPVKQFINFALSSIAFRLMEYGLFILLLSWANAYYLFALSCAMIVTFVLKYFFQKKIVFR